MISNDGGDVTRHTRQRWCWTSLPPELVDTITTTFDSPTDIQNLRLTCKRWWSATRPPPLRQSPLFLPLTLTFPSGYRRPNFIPNGASLTLFSTTVYIVSPLIASSGPPWIVAVEKRREDKQRLLHLLTRLTVDVYDNSIDFTSKLSGFKTVKVSQSINLRLEKVENNDGANVIPNAPHYKVIMWENNHGRFFMILQSTGKLTCFRVDDECVVTHWKELLIDENKIDDLIYIDDKIFAVSNSGATVVWSMETLSTDVCHSNSRFRVGVIITDYRAVIQLREQSNRRKRLVFDGNDLFLIVRSEQPVYSKFHVYKLGMHEDRQWAEWKYIETLGDKVLFVSLEECFFVQANDLPGFRGNCIVFTKDCFPNTVGCNRIDQALFNGGSGYLDQVGVYKYGEGHDFNLISAYRGYSNCVWPPPPWIWEDNSSHDQRKSADGCYGEWLMDVVNLELSAVSSVISCIRVGSPDMSSSEGTIPSSETQSGLQPIDTQCLGERRGSATRFNNSAALNRLREGRSFRLDYETYNSNSNFHGVHVSPASVPILQELWAKHGNITEGNVAGSSAALGMALEALVNMRRILQSSTEFTMTPYQVEILKSTLCDLQHMCLRVDWLISDVEKALALHEQKPLVTASTGLDCVETCLKEIQEMSAMENRHSFSGPIDVENLLGDGV